MNIKASYKKPKGKTEKQKKIIKEKKSKGPKINSNYKDMSPCNVSGVDIDLTKLKYGIIDSCNLTSIIIDNELIMLKNSWVEAVIMMLDTLIENYPDDYRSKLLEYEITSHDLYVDTTYGVYKFDGVEYKAYKIYNRNLYIESTFSYETIFRALVGLAKALDIALDAIQFHVVSKDYVDSKLDFKKLKRSDIVVDIDNALEHFLHYGHYLMSVKIFGDTIEAHHLENVLVLFCNLVYDALEEDGSMIVNLGGNRSTGITLTKNIEDMGYVPIRDTEIFIYSDKDEEGIIDFIKSSMDTLGLDKDDLLFKFEIVELKEKEHEWEVD